MVGIEKLALVVHHGAACGGASGERVPPRHTFHRFIKPRQEGIHGSVDVIGAAERSHHTGLGRGISLFGLQALGVHLGARDLGPCGHVPPVRKGGQQTVSRQQGLVRPSVYVFRVCAAAGPVHEPGCLKGRRVKGGHAGVDVVGDPSGAGFILVHGHGAVQWKQHPEPGSPRCVLPGGIYTVAAAQALQPPQHVVGAAGGQIVHVQGQHVAPGDGVTFAPLPPQGAGYEAAHIFELGLLILLHGEVFRLGLGAPYRNRELFVQLRDI